MNEPPNPVNRKALSRASIAGGILAVAGIILFVVVWIVLGQAGMTQLTRLFISLCLPPALIALVMGIYMLVARPRL